MVRTITTEKDWLRATNPSALWYSRFARDGRKRILAACACARRVLPVLGDDPRAVALVEAVEQYADATPSEAAARWRVVLAARRPVQAWRKQLETRATPRREDAALWAVYSASHCEGAGPSGVFYAAQRAGHSRSLTPGVTEMQAQMAVVRDIFGNPFRPVSLDPVWLTPNVRDLALAAYDERELPSGHFDRTRLAILADALLDAGCDSDGILSHLRGPGPHVRGCWVIDLLLGKS